jgi:hypothetical protein
MQETEKQQAVRIKQLAALLSDAEEKYQLSLTQRVEATEVLTGLQVQLVQTKVLLSGRCVVAA